MEKDAHYYAILAFCRACGFKKESAHVVAYASQLVDDATINLIFFNNPKPNLQHDVVADRPAFFNMATCHSYFRIKTFNYEAMVNNTSAFHFVPGCKGESFTKRLRCKEESPVILDILKDVFVEDDLIKLGMALHAYADTFSHQGFSGMLSKVNDIKNCQTKTRLHLGLCEKVLSMLKQFSQRNYEKYFDFFVPAYGHSQAMEFPDIPYLGWSYEYDYSGEFNGSYKLVEVDNKARYQRAFARIRQYLESYISEHKQYLDNNLRFKNFDILMGAIIFARREQVRVRNWQKVLVEQGLFSENDAELTTYQGDKWLKEAFTNYDPKVFNNRVVDGAQLANDFVHTNWYRFYQAVKWYKQKFFAYCAQYQLNIPK